MQKKRISSLGLAGVACVIGVATWMSPSMHDARVAGGSAQSSDAAPRIAMPAGATFASPQPFALDAARMRAAVRDGTLRITLPDGREHAIPIERQFTDESGHWNVVGRAPTQVGAQAMVLTFGADAVFGRIPMPDGSAMHVFTAPGNRVVVAPDGGVVPAGTMQIAGRTDVVTPERDRLPQALRASSMPPPTPTPTSSVAPRASASRPVRIDAATTTATPPAGTSSRAALPRATAAVVDTTPVTIDAITLFSTDQVTLRGSVSAVQTEIANLLAISNQAHIDSGSRVRLRSVHVRQVNVSTTDPNTSVLQAIAYQPVDDLSLEALRDQYGGDVVTLLRPYHETDWTCGVAYSPGMPYWRTQTIAQFAYGVINVDGTCGTLVHAHEIGHNLGSMHDRETDTDSVGATLHGAYVFSSGYRTPTFATVMAYTDGSLEQKWIGRFSNPDKTDCVGAPCGIAGYSDNVRSLNLMAPAIAALRGPAGKLSISDVEAIEPAYGTTTLQVPIRLSGVATTGGVAVQVQVVGGTATVGDDYQPIAPTVGINEGERETMLAISINPDALAEGDETIQLHIVPPAGRLASDADATITISESDPRIAFSGHVWFPPGKAPTTSVFVQVENIDGYGNWGNVEAFPPDFDFTVRAPYGMQVRSWLQVVEPLIHPQQTINEVRDDREWQLYVQKGVHVSGRLRVAEGMTMPWNFVQLSYAPVYRNIQSYYNVTLSPPDFAYSIYLPATSNVRFEVPNLPEQPGAVQFVPYEGLINDLRSDRTYDIVLSNLPSARVCCWWSLPEPTPETHLEATIAVWLSAPAPAGGAKVRWTTVDGTAKAGQDYVARSGTLTIPEGEWVGYPPAISVLVDNVEEGPEYFDVVIDRPTGVQIGQPRARVQILSNGLRTGGPQAAVH